MSIPSTFAPIKKQDFTLVKVPVQKSYSITSANLVNTSSGYTLVEGYYTKLKTPVDAPQSNNDPRNSFDNTFKHIIWKSIDHLYYRNPYNPYTSFEHNNRRYSWKFLNRTASILSVPYMDYGERMLPGTIQISSSLGYFIKDDKNGNLYDSTINTSSYATRHNVVAYWGFNDLFRKFKHNFGMIQNGTIKYISHTFEPDNLSGVRNVYFESGVPINGTGSGLAAQFNGSSYILTHNRQEYNFDSTQDFTISFWLKAPLSQSNVGNSSNALLTKNGALYKQIFGEAYTYTTNGEKIAYRGVSASLLSEKTDIFPYNFEIYNQTSIKSGKLIFSRSDGINTTTLESSGSLNDSSYHHIAVTKENSTIKLFVNGNLEDSVIDSTKHPINNHALLFGARNLEFRDGFSGSLDEIRIYDKALSLSNIQTLANNVNMSIYQTSVIGNIFYRKGNIVISSLDPKYQSTFNNSWTLNYSGQHTIFQYEVLCRVKKGAFNLTMNPTARKSPNSDIYRDELTGSLMMPYATSIGMYNDRGDLVAIGKLSQPTQMREDVDINFLVRWNV